MIIRKEKIENYIPQRAPFIMIDNLLEATAESFKTDFQILPGNIFIENGFLREFALIENIAQSSSAGLAVTNLFPRNKAADGFMGGISKLTLYELPGVHDKIHTCVTVITRIDNLFLIRGETYLNEMKLLECELQLAGI